jgi:probable HAF family extracellular repeat protein
MRKPPAAKIVPFCGTAQLKKNLGTLGGAQSHAFAINGTGQVTGSADTASGNAHAFLWNGTTLKDLGTLGGATSRGIAINASGQVTGESKKTGPRTHAFLWNGSRMRDIDQFGSDFSRGNAINSSGQVTGLISNDPGNNVYPNFDYAFIWDGTTTIRIIPSESCFPPFGEGLSINVAGHATGYSGCDEIAFLWIEGNKYDLNELIDPQDPLKSRVFLTKGVDINARDQIAANGIFQENEGGYRSAAFLVTPMEYQLQLIKPLENSNWHLGATMIARAVLVDAKGKRIVDSRAVSLVNGCKVKFSVGGSQSLAPACMQYNISTGEFYFSWKLAATGIGAASLKFAASYKFSMPQMITTSKSRAITIIQ